MTTPSNSSSSNRQGGVATTPSTTATAHEYDEFLMKVANDADASSDFVVGLIANYRTPYDCTYVWYAVADNLFGQAQEENTKSKISKTTLECAE